jgi:MraZ protein
VFLGQYPRNLDPKGRIAIPATYREQLPTGSVMTLAPEGALRVYPPAEWAAVTENLKLSAATDPKSRSLIRRMFAVAHQVEYDGQGRVLIPSRLRTEAEIGTSAVVAGANNVVEIWSEERWAQLESSTADITRLADEVAARGEIP